MMTYNLKFASPTFEPSWEVRHDMQVALEREIRERLLEWLIETEVQPTAGRGGK